MQPRHNGVPPSRFASDLVFRRPPGVSYCGSILACSRLINTAAVAMNPAIPEIPEFDTRLAAPRSSSITAVLDSAAMRSAIPTPACCTKAALTKGRHSATRISRTTGTGDVLMTEAPSLDWLLNRSPLTISALSLARSVDVSPDLIYDAIRRGEIQTVPIGRRRRIPRDVALAFVNPLLEHMGIAAETDADNAMDMDTSTPAAETDTNADSATKTTSGIDVGADAPEDSGTRTSWD